MYCIREGNVMENHFMVTFPLVLESNSTFKIIFTSQDNSVFEFKKGVYYLAGDNGSGKTTFINMLALIAGSIGKKADKKMGLSGLTVKLIAGLILTTSGPPKYGKRTFVFFLKESFSCPSPPATIILF